MEDISEVIDDPTKSTLFGRFYEEIVSTWLVEVDGLKKYEGKPKVEWTEVQPASGEGEAVTDLNWQLKANKAGKHYCIPDGLFTKDSKHYLWEAKNWPQWSTWTPGLERLKSGLHFLPVVLAKRATIGGKPIVIDGFIFSWWSRPEGAAKTEDEFKRIVSPREFRIVYTSEVLADCIDKNYGWYRSIISRERDRANQLFDGLLRKVSEGAN